MKNLFINTTLNLINLGEYEIKEIIWESPAKTGRKLLLLNKLPETYWVKHPEIDPTKVTRLSNIRLGYLHKGYHSFIYLNEMEDKEDPRDTGIFISDKKISSNIPPIFLGASEDPQGIVTGSFGIFKPLTIVTVGKGEETWMLKASGWELLNV